MQVHPNELSCNPGEHFYKIILFSWWETVDTKMMFFRGVGKLENICDKETGAKLHIKDLVYVPYPVALKLDANLLKKDHVVISIGRITKQVFISDTNGIPSSIHNQLRKEIKNSPTVLHKNLLFELLEGTFLAFGLR